MNDLQAVDIVFICSDESEADTLVSMLNAMTGGHADVQFTDISVASSMGAFKSKKFVSAALAFSGTLASGVAGNALYDVLKHLVTTQVVVAGEPVDKAACADKIKLDDKVRAAARPKTRKVDKQ